LIGEKDAISIIMGCLDEMNGLSKQRKHAVIYGERAEVHGGSGNGRAQDHLVPLGAAHSVTVCCAVM